MREQVERDVAISTVSTNAPDSIATCDAWVAPSAARTQVPNSNPYPYPYPLL